MSFEAMAWAVRHELPVKQKIVLLMLANRTNSDTGRCDPSHKRLATDCGMSVSSVKRAIFELEQMGILSITHKSLEDVQLPNQYQLNLDGVGSHRPGGLGLCDLGVGSHRPTKQEYNQEVETPCPQQAGDGHKFRFAEIQDAYNRICAPTLPACRSATPARKQRARQMVELEFNGKRPFREHGLAMWEGYFSDCLTNKHWCGENDRNWRADFDFVVNTKNAIKLLERICG